MLLIGKAGDDGIGGGGRHPYDRERHSSTEEEVLLTVLRTMILYLYAVPTITALLLYDRRTVDSFHSSCCCRCRRASATTVGLTTTIPYCGDTIPYRYEATHDDDGGVRQRVQLDNYAATSILAHAHQLWMREDGFDPQGYLWQQQQPLPPQKQTQQQRGGCAASK